MTHNQFSTILADPPWDVEQKGHRGAQMHYDLMTLERVKRMPVADLAAADAHLWLWVTNATLRAGYDVAEAWGFTVRSPLTWVKFRLGLGNYLRNSTEHVLFATRGKAPVLYRAQPTWINAPVTDHSHKPEEQYALIERVSPGPYLELSPAAVRSRRPIGRCGATRLTPTSRSRVTRYRGTPSAPASCAFPKTRTHRWPRPTAPKTARRRR
ncbi:Transcriptional activator%2C adenine-specific DNA methyltransferase [Mycobacteroides abscessus]|nr:Transcriptional activator%2C adenine-specific DNA methyltransferase [Mycobacteroides abscessus]